MAAGNFDLPSGREAIRRLLAPGSSRPTAVFAGNDPMAVGAICACREAGLSVPGDVSIMGAGNIEGDYNPSPFLSTIDWPRVELGRIAATMLIAAIANPEQEAALHRASTVRERLRFGQIPGSRDVRVQQMSLRLQF